MDEPMQLFDFEVSFSLWYHLSIGYWDLFIETRGEVCYIFVALHLDLTVKKKLFEFGGNKKIEKR